MARRGEGAAHHIDQESGCSPDANSRHAGQDRMKRVSKHQALNLIRYLVASDTKGRQLLRQARQDDARSLSPQDHDSLLRQRLEDLCGPGLPHARSEFDESISQLFLSERSQLCGRRIALEQVQHGWVIQVWADHTLEGRMDLRQQTTDTVADLRDLAGQIFARPAMSALGQPIRALRRPLLAGPRRRAGSTQNDAA